MINSVILKKLLILLLVCVDMKNKSQLGAVALMSTLVIATAVLAIITSLMLLSINNKSILASFVDSVQGFYTAESAVSESLWNLRKQPSEFIFDDITVGGILAGTEFIEESGICEPIPECQFLPDSGWWGEYFNYSVDHPDMQVDPYPGPTPDPRDHDWYDDIYKTHTEINADLMFGGSSWFPYDGTEWEDKEGYAHDYHFGMHWRALVTAPATDNYSYAIASDDDSWVLHNNVVVVNNSGVHANFIKTGEISLAEGNNIVEVYFAERHTTGSAMDFNFDDESLIITPFPEGCGDDLDCNSNIQSTASTTRATRKVRYTCNQNIANCVWAELIP